MTPYRMRVRLRDALGRLAVCVVLIASVAGQQHTEPQEHLQREAMKKFGFLVGKWSGNARWFTRQGVFDLIATEDVHYEQNGLVLKIHAQELKPDGTPVLGSVLRISYDDISGTYRLESDLNHKGGALEIDDDWRGIMVQFKLPERTTLEMLRVNEKGEWAEVHWVTEGNAPQWMFLQAVVRRQKELRSQNNAHGSARNDDGR